MTQPTPAERAEAVIKAAHLDDIYMLEPVPNTHPVNGRAGRANEVWYYGPYVLRIHPEGGELAQAAILLRYLPRGIPHAAVVAAGEGWIVQRRVEGDLLSAVWESLGEAKQRAAAQQLAAILINLHQTRVSGMPSLSPGWFTSILPADILTLATRLRDQPGIDSALIDDAAIFTRHTMARITPPLRWGFIHRDLSFDHVLWHDDRITALLDFENAVYAPRELELEALLRDAPPALRGWLQEDDPLLLSEAGLDQRLKLYGIERDLRSLTADPTNRAILDHLRAIIAE